MSATFTQAASEDYADAAVAHVEASLARGFTMHDEHCTCPASRIAEDGTYHYAFCPGRKAARENGQVIVQGLGKDSAGNLVKIPSRIVNGRLTRV